MSKIILKNNYVSNTHLEMIPGLHKIINKESWLSYRNLIIAIIKYSD